MIFNSGWWCLIAGLCWELWHWLLYTALATVQLSLTLLVGLTSKYIYDVTQYELF